VGLDQRRRQRIARSPYINASSSGCRTGNVSHLLLPFLAICSSDLAGRMPGARTQSKQLPIEIVAGNRQTSSRVCTQPQTQTFRSGFESSTNVGAGCSCHPTGSDHLRSTRVPLHPVWPRTVARFWGLIRPKVLRASFQNAILLTSMPRLLGLALFGPKNLALGFANRNRGIGITFVLACEAI
jgi:hypothetical protein